MTGVLVLIEQHHPVAVAQVVGDLREVRGKPCRRSHLHAEVHDLVGVHAVLQRVEQRHQFGALGLGGQQPQQPLARSTVALVGAGGQGVDQPLQLQVGIAELAGVDQVLGQLAPQSQHHRGDRGRRLVGAQLPAVPVDHVEGQLPQLGLAEQPGVGFDRQQ